MDEKIKFTQEEIKKKEVAEKKTFKIFSCDQTFTDPDVIDYLKICLREFCDANHLLGKFTDDGKYYLQNEIKKDLVQMEKEISLMEEGVFYASNSYLKKPLILRLLLKKLKRTGQEPFCICLKTIWMAGKEGNSPPLWLLLKKLSMAISISRSNQPLICWTLVAICMKTTFHKSLFSCKDREKMGFFWMNLLNSVLKSMFCVCLNSLKVQAKKAKRY